MATPDFLKWLAREEEEFGLTGAITRTIDPEACRRMLREELVYDPSEKQVTAMYEAGRYKYETMPQIGVTPSLYVRPYGQQIVYRDIATGRFISAEEVQRRTLGF